MEIPNFCMCDLKYISYTQPLISDSNCLAINELGVWSYALSLVPSNNRMWSTNMAIKFCVSAEGTAMGIRCRGSLYN